MRINGNPNIQSFLKRYENNVKKTEDVSTLTSNTSDKVEISQAAKEYQLAMQAIKADPSVRTEKVEAIKSQIASGSYKISAEALAEKILNG